MTTYMIDVWHRQVLVSRLQATRKYVCTWPTKCQDPVCLLWWFCFDFFITQEDRESIGNVAEDHGDSQLSVKRR